MTKPKEWKGWAVVNEDGALCEYDKAGNSYSDLPIFDSEGAAKRVARLYYRKAKMVPVRITALKPKKV